MATEGGRHDGSQAVVQAVQARLQAVVARKTSSTWMVHYE
jgi:hypothetical protein